MRFSSSLEDKLSKHWLVSLWILVVTVKHHPLLSVLLVCGLSLLVNLGCTPNLWQKWKKELMACTYDDTITKHYRIIKTLGLGVFTEVQLGSHLCTNSRVTIKIFYKNQNKARPPTLTLKLNYLGTLTLWNIFHVTERSMRNYIVTEYMADRDLAYQKMACGCIKEKEATCPIFHQMIKTINYHHKKISSKGI